MATWNAFTMASMPLLSYTGLSGMMGTASRNGFLPMLRGEGETQGTTNSVFAAPIRISQSMIHFFLPIVSLDDAGVSLQGARFLAIWMAVWLMMNSEAMRGIQSDLRRS